MQYWYKIQAVGAQIVEGTFTTDANGDWTETIAQNPSIFDWSANVEMYSDSNLNVLEFTSNDLVNVTTSTNCPPFILRRGCAAIDPVALQDLRCQIKKMQDFHAQLGNGQGDCSFCTKAFEPIEITKQCADCDTGKVITQIDICATLSENLNLFLASVSF